MVKVLHSVVAQDAVIALLAVFLCVRKRVLTHFRDVPVGGPPPVLLIRLVEVKAFLGVVLPWVFARNRFEQV